MFHSLLKVNYNHSKTLLPLLLMIKSLAKNCKCKIIYCSNFGSSNVNNPIKSCEYSWLLSAVALQILVKDGIVPTLEKTFVCVGYTPHLKLKTLLECFKYFTVSSKFAKYRYQYFQ